MPVRIRFWTAGVAEVMPLCCQACVYSRGRVGDGGCRGMGKGASGAAAKAWDRVCKLQGFGTASSQPFHAPPPAPQAKEVASQAIERLSSLNRRTLDVLAARIYFYYSWAHEGTNTLDTIRRWGGSCLAGAPSAGG